MTPSYRRAKALRLVRRFWASGASGLWYIQASGSYTLPATLVLMVRFRRLHSSGYPGVPVLILSQCALLKTLVLMARLPCRDGKPDFPFFPVVFLMIKNCLKSFLKTCSKHYKKYNSLCFNNVFNFMRLYKKL